MKFMPALILLILIHGCSSTNSTITNVLVTEKGSDSPDAFCSDFSLTNGQATDFFERSKEIEITELHDNYEYLPCYIKGTLKRGNTKCNFILRAGGTAELTCNNNTGYLYACDSCDDLLGAEKQ